MRFLPGSREGECKASRPRNPTVSRFQHIRNVVIEIGRHLSSPTAVSALAAGQLVGSGHVAAGEEVELDLGLGPRGPGGESGARALGVEDQQVARGLGQGAGGIRPVDACGSRGSCSRTPR